jgi:hypothetical protein
MSPTVIGTAIKNLEIKAPFPNTYADHIARIMWLLTFPVERMTAAHARRGSAPRNDTPLLSGIVTLTLKNCGLTDSELVQISSLKTLTSLNISSNHTFTNFGLKALTKLPQLKYLVLAFCRCITDYSFIELTNMTQLQHLDLGGCFVSNAGVHELVKLPQLTSLAIWNSCLLSDTGLGSLGNITTLKALYLPECAKITDEGVAALAVSKSLTTLDLSRCQRLTKQCLDSLSKMDQLRTLHLKWVWNITSSMLLESLRCKSLEVLHFYSEDYKCDLPLQEISKRLRLYLDNANRCCIELRAVRKE